MFFLCHIYRLGSSAVITVGIEITETAVGVFNETCITCFHTAVAVMLRHILC